MNNEIDYAAFELGQATPRLREDLRFSQRQSKHGPFYVIEDETNSKFYRVGLSEYTFLSLLDGDTTVQSAVAATAAELGIEAFTEAEAAAVCKWLVDSQLAEKKRNDETRWKAAQLQKKLADRMQWINPVMLKLPLGNPDRVVTTLTAITGWMVNFYVGILVLGIVLLAVMFGLANSDSLYARNSTVLSPDNWLWLGFAWIVLRVVHESAHSVVCKHYGGRVREWGLLLIMFIPLPYVDVTTAWRFPQRSARILTSAAGMIAELFLAAIATLVWCQTESAIVRQHALNVMLAGSFTTLLFNANPLMRFDGYHILTDLLDAPNLWTHGRQYVRSLGRRYFLGLSTSSPPWRTGEASLIKVYGIAAALWKVLITVSLMLTAMSLLDGIGLILALVSCVLWIGIPTYQLARFVVCGTPTEQPNRSQFVIVMLGLFACALTLGLAVPAPSVISAPIVVQYDPLTIIRNNTAGFIVDMPIQVGQELKQGDVVCRLENVDLIAKCKRVRLQLLESQQRLRAFQAAGDPSAIQIEIETTEDLQRQVQEVDLLIEELVIVAPTDGVVVSEDLYERIGTYVSPGSELVVLGGTGPMKAIGLVSQDLSDSLRNLHSDHADVRVWGASGGTIKGRVKKVHPRAQTSLPHFSFAAAVGGGLAVIQQQPTQDSREAGNWSLAKPHVSIDIELDASSSRRLLSGQTGNASVRADQGALGKYLVKHVYRFLRDRIKRSHGL